MSSKSKLGLLIFMSTNIQAIGNSTGKSYCTSVCKVDQQHERQIKILKIYFAYGVISEMSCRNEGYFLAYPN